jgi:hydrogenase 3 maturation protease
VAGFCLISLAAFPPPFIPEILSLILFEPVRTGSVVSVTLMRARPQLPEDHWMNLLLGIGNPLRGDDGAGVLAALHLKAEGWQAVDCGTAPENFTGLVRRLHPDLLLLVDAAEMGIPPGEFRVVPKDRIEDVAFGTHHLPLSHVMEFLSDTAGEIRFIGIQPAVVEDGEGLSPDVEEGVRKLLMLIHEGELDRVAVLEPLPG